MKSNKLMLCVLLGFTSSVNAVPTTFSTPTIDSLSLSSTPPQLNSSNQIIYKSTPSFNIITEYVSCVTPNKSDICNVSDEVLEIGEISGDGNLPIDITIPNNVELLGKYLTYCVRVTETIRDNDDYKNVSNTVCNSEKIKSALETGLSDSYLKQENDFSLYEKNSNFKNDDVVTSNSAIMFNRDGIEPPLIYGKDLEVINAPNSFGNISQIFSMLDSFVVLQQDNQLITWGHNVSDTSYSVPNVMQVFAGPYAMSLVSLDGSITTLGNAEKGAEISAEAKTQIQYLRDLGGKIDKIYHTAEAFLGVFNMPDGHQRLIAWGTPNFGGALPAGLFSQSFDIKNVVTSQDAFSVLNKNGEVYSWSHDSALKIFTNVHSIYASRYAFAAITIDNNVITWGESGYGGSLTSEAKQFTTSKEITRICATDSAFLAMADGDSGVVSWGNTDKGGYIPNSMQSVLNKLVIDNDISCASTEGAFALYRSDGVWVWGDHGDGGVFPTTIPTSNIKNIIGNNHAFLMATSTNIYQWGDEASGGCLPDGNKCISPDNTTLDLQQELSSLDFEQVKIGSFDNFSENENKTLSGFYIKDANKALVWGNAVPDGYIAL